MPDLEQSTAGTQTVCGFVDKDDGVTEEDGLAGSMVARIDKGDGVGFIARNSAGAITFDEDGSYNIPLSATDRDTLGILIIKVVDPATHLYVWDKFDIIDSITEPTVNVTKISGSAVAADNLELDYDGTGYAKGGASSIAAVADVTGDVQGNLIGNVQGDVTGSILGDIMIKTTIATRTNAVVFTLTAGPPDDDAIKNCMVMIEDQATTNQRMFGYVAAYTGGTKEVTLKSDPGVFVTAVGDNIRVYPLDSANVWLIEDVIATNQINTACDDSIVTYNLDHWMAVAVTGADVVDDSALAKLVSKSATADFDTFVNTTDSFEAVRDKLTDIETDTAVIGVAGAGLSNIPWNAAWDAEVESEVTDVVGAAGVLLTSIPWNAAWDAEVESEVQDVVGAAGASLTGIPWNSVWDAEVQSEVNDALVVLHLDHVFAVDYDPANKPGVATALFNELIEDDGGVSRYTVNALEQAPSGGGGGGGDWTAAEVAQIRAALGITGTTSATSGTGITDLIKVQTDKIGSASIIVVATVFNSTLEIVKGNSYSTTSGQTIGIVKPSGASWPTDITGYAITFTASVRENNKNTGETTITSSGTVITPTGASQKVQIDLTVAETDGLAEGQWDYDVVAVSGAVRVQLLGGLMNVVLNQTAI